VESPTSAVSPKAPSSRFALIVDAADYYAAVASCLRQARSEVVVLAWDFDTRAPVRVDEFSGAQETLRDVLIEVLEANPALRVRVLCWDFAFVYARDREHKPHVGLASSKSGCRRWVRGFRGRA
jgi:phosphatidylserine/phosphatidylglycerophosphate/cardiolipin synthase-like enzyme